MDYAVNVWMCGKDLVKLGFVCNVHGEEVGALARDQLDPIDTFL